MTRSAPRRSVDLSAWPDLVVIYLGMRVRNLRGLATLFRIGRGLTDLRKIPPDGLLAHETLLLGPLHLGMRQYWRDFEALERVTKENPHRAWWLGFLKDNGGTGFWHETYSARRGIEAIYIGMPPLGLARFAPERVPQGPYMTARERLERAGAT
jgi:hypothetical protein